MNKKTRWILVFTLMLLMVFTFDTTTWAVPENVDLPNISVDFGGDGTPTDYVNNIKLLLVLTVLTLLPSFIIMMTCFTRIVVVFSFLKSALGATQSIPNQILTGLAIFLTIFIMSPVVSKINTEAITPYLNEEITQDEAIELGIKPLRDFMLKQTRQKDLELFVEAANIDQEELTKDNIPITAVIPAFVISELKTAFEIGFLLFLPFLIIDMVVASVLMSMGMFMLPPTMIALPFKLLLFVMVDGWFLIVKSMIMSFS